MRNSLEELETLDIPRGLVAAANRYAASKVSVLDLVTRAKVDPAQGPSIIESGQALYKEHFDAFIAGAKWMLPETPDKAIEKLKAFNAAIEGLIG